MRLWRERNSRAAVPALAFPLLFLLVFFYLPLAGTLWTSVWRNGFTLQFYQRALGSALYVNALLVQSGKCFTSRSVTTLPTSLAKNLRFSWRT